MKSEEDKEREETEIMGDEYDVYGRSFKIHNKKIRAYGITEDFKYSDLHEKASDKQRLVRKTQIMVRHIESFMNLERFQKNNMPKFISVKGQKVPTRGTSAGFTDEEIQKVKEIAQGATSRLMGDMTTLAVLSSSNKGRIINAVTARLKQEGNRQEEQPKLSDEIKPKKGDENE